MYSRFKIDYDLSIIDYNNLNNKKNVHHNRLPPPSLSITILKTQ